MSAPSSPSFDTTRLAALVARLQGGDRAAANELFACVKARLERLARSMLRCYPVVRTQEQTADVFQEAAFRLQAALRDVTPSNTEHFFALASQHIRYHLLDLVRKCRRGAPQPLHEHAEPVAPGTGPAEVEDLERWQTFHEIVEKLPDEEREVIGLRFYNGCTWSEIADLLRIDARTAQRRWDRGCLALQKKLNGWLPHADAAEIPANG